MIRKAFMMRLQPGGLAMYKKYHDEVWPELVAEIERKGIATVSYTHLTLPTKRIV